MYLETFCADSDSGRGSLPIYEDNAACIEWGNVVISGCERAKHIDIRKNFAHEVIQNGEMRLIKVATKYQLTISLPRGKFRK